MNKLIASVGAVAISATAVHAAGVETIDPAKPWSVSLSLRGFYDDNYTTAHSGTNKQDSVGASIAPSVALNLPLERTTMGLRYTFGAKWYEARESMNSANDAWDYSHQLDAFLNHEFSDRYTLNLNDSFVAAQEPELLNETGFFYRTEGNNIRNRAEANFTAILTRQLSVVLGYQNTLVDYENSGGDFTDPSLSGLLDRMEHLGLLNLRWQARKDSVVVLGYNYGEVNYDGNETITLARIPGPGITVGPVSSKHRNNRSHQIYAGIDQNFSKDLLLTVRGGAEYVDYFNDSFSDSTTSPYGQLSLSYNYLPGSSVSVGWNYKHIPTDVVAVDPLTGEITQDADASVFFATVNHHFNALWTGYLNGYWQSIRFNGGAYDGNGDDFIGLGAGLRYRFNQHLSAEAGYNFDNLSSDLALRGYDRNRVFLGVTATY